MSFQVPGLPWGAQKKLWRGIEGVFCAAEYVWGWVAPDPKIIQGPGAIAKIPAEVAKKGGKSVLVVTDANIHKLGLLDKLEAALKEVGLNYVIYDEVQPNPSIENVETGLKAYKENNCDCAIAVGGGSAMDCAKAILARVARPRFQVKTLGKMVFMVVFTGLVPPIKLDSFLPPPLYAVPTTAGTGSETTIASVITDTQTKDKFPITDPLIRARYAVLDPELTVGLPTKVTSTTGLDALTHAIEGYTNIWYNDKRFNDLGKEAIRLIFKYLETACTDPGNLEAREQMLVAAYDAGMCFTRGGVGYVHGIGHRLGGLYHIPHGLAMSVILCHVFSDDFLGPYVQEELAELAEVIGITGGTASERAHKFMREVRKLEDKLDIPYGFAEIKDEDIPIIAERCIYETNPTYPVKHIFTQKEIEHFIATHIQLKDGNDKPQYLIDKDW